MAHVPSLQLGQPMVAGGTLTAWPAGWLARQTRRVFLGSTAASTGAARLFGLAGRVMQWQVASMVNQGVAAEIRLLPAQEEAQASVEARQAWERFVSRPLHGVNVPDEALRRENLYEERA